MAIRVAFQSVGFAPDLGGPQRARMVRGRYCKAAQARGPGDIDVRVLPNPQPLQYVKICSLYGAGFYYIPGTDTCLKVGGAVRAEMDFNAGGSFGLPAGKDQSARSYDFTYSRVRALLTLDARTQTEYGTLRTYLQLGQQYDNGGGPDAGWAARAFIQWAGFTFGHTDSFFDFWSNAVYSNQGNWTNATLGGAGTNVWAYTAQFGNGLSASISAEDPVSRRVGIYNQGGSEAGYAGRQWPDAVGNLRIDQAWGSAQVMGAIHQVRGLTSGSDVGYAAGAGVKVNLPWAKGDNFTVEADYANGAIDYVGHGYKTTSFSTDGTTYAYTNAYDAVTNTSGGLEKTTGWSVVAGIQHNWNSMWNTSLYGYYGQISYNDTAKSVLGGDPNWSIGQIGSRTKWTPVKGLTFSAELMYTTVNTATSEAGFVKTNSGDVNWLSGMIRVQRSF